MTSAQIQQRFEEINAILSGLEPCRENYDKAILPKDEKEIAAYVETTYSTLKSDLQQISGDIEGLKQRLDTNEDDMDDRDREILRTNIASFYKILQEQLIRAHAIYTEFKNASKQKLTRQIKNVDTEGQFTDEQIGQMVEESPDALSRLVQQKVFGKASLRLQYAAQDISEKCEGIKQLQKNVKELLNMLREISQIISLQGEQINTIADHVKSAKDHMAKANDNLKQAKEHHQSARCVY